jgi:hypothetical protein
MRATSLGLLLGVAVLVVPTGAHATIQNAGSLEGFYTSDDGYNHAIIAKTDGTVNEAYWSTGGSTLGTSVLHSFTAGSVKSVAGYFTSGDGYRHAIVALNSGNVYEIYYKPSVGINIDLLATFSTVTIADIAACVHGSDGSQNVYVLTTGGYVYDVRWISGQGINVTNIGYTGNFSRVACYDNQTGSHVISAGNSTSNSFSDIYWTTWGTFNSTTLSGTTNGPTGLGAFPLLTSGYPWGHNIVYGTGAALKQYVLGTASTIWTFAQTISAVGGFSQPLSSGAQHVLTYTSNGSLYDMYDPSGTWTADYLGSF